MPFRCLSVIFAGLAALLSSASAEPIPPTAQAMLDAAAATNDVAQVEAVAHAARTVFPKSAAEIDAYAEAFSAAIAVRLEEAAGDLVVVTGAPTERAAPEGVDDSVDAPEIPPGRAPEWLKLGPWKGKATASGLVSSGNSRNSAAGLRVEARRELEALTHNITLYFDYGKSRGVNTQQRWGSSYKLDVKLGERTYGYARIAYDEDAFSGFDYKLFGGLGVGRRLIDRPRLKLKAEGGPGYQYAPIDNTREVESRAAFYASSEFDWVIRNGLKFDQDLNVTVTDPSSTFISNTALTVSLTDTLSTGLSYVYRFETDPPPGRVRTDTTFRMNLTYGF